MLVAHASSSTTHSQRVHGLPRCGRPRPGTLLNFVFAVRSSNILATCPLSMHVMLDDFYDVSVFVVLIQLEIYANATSITYKFAAGILRVPSGRFSSASTHRVRKEPQGLSWCGTALLL